MHALTQRGLELVPQLLVGNLMMIDDFRGLNLRPQITGATTGYLFFASQIFLNILRTQNLLHEIARLKKRDRLFDGSWQQARWSLLCSRCRQEFTMHSRFEKDVEEQVGIGIRPNRTDLYTRGLYIAHRNTHH